MLYMLSITTYCLSFVCRCFLKAFLPFFFICEYFLLTPNTFLRTGIWREPWFWKDITWESAFSSVGICIPVSSWAVRGEYWVSPDLVLTAVKVEKELPLPLVFIFSIKILSILISEGYIWCISSNTWLLWRSKVHMFVRCKQKNFVETFFCGLKIIYVEKNWTEYFNKVSKVSH